MNITFFGSSAFSVPALTSIQTSVSGVVTKKAKPKGRGYLLDDNEVGQTADRLGLPLLEIDSFKDENAERVGEMKPDLFVVASFGLIIPRRFLEMPAVGAINVHPSLLPLYRGPSPIQWVLWNGESETGITIIRMSPRMDAGDILYQETVEISKNDDARTLSERLSTRVAEILPDFIAKIDEDRKLDGVLQQEENATYTPMITKEMGRIDWQAGALETMRQVRALVLWPVAYTFLDGKLLKVFGAYLEERTLKAEPGTVIDVRRDGVVVATHNGVLVLEEVQLENRKRMGGYEFGKGYRGLIGKKLT